MITKKIPLGPINANTYIVFDEKSKEAALVDCTGDIDTISKELESLGANLKYILITHGHFDHVYSLFEMKKRFQKALVVIGKGEKFLISKLKEQCALFGTSTIKQPEIDLFVDENSKLTLGEIEIKVIGTKGHTEGGVCYLIGDELFSGDTLFYEEIGRCDLPTGSFSEIEKSIREKLFKLDENIKVCPGHGQDSTIGHEKVNNAYFGQNARY